MFKPTLTVPGSPEWSPYLDVKIRKLPISFQWSGLVKRLSSYPNLSLQCDLEESEIAAEELKNASEYWKQECRNEFPCSCKGGRQTLSKRQKNKKLVSHIAFRCVVKAI